MSRVAHAGKSQRGMALVLTLVVLALLIAITTEFITEVNAQTGAMAAWRAGQNLGLASESGAALAGALIQETLSTSEYSYPGVLDLPPQDPLEMGIGVAVRLEDEDGKFNLNSLVNPNGEINEERRAAFVRLLKALELDPAVADLVVDYIDADSIERAPGGEENAANAPMRSPEELMLALRGVAGDGQAIYNTLVTHVTVWGSGRININAATAPVLMSLSDSIDSEMAARVARYRELDQFGHASEIQRVAGFESLGITLLGRISVKGTAFRITSTATDQDGLVRIAECVMDATGRVLYWRAY